MYLQIQTAVLLRADEMQSHFCARRESSEPRRLLKTNARHAHALRGLRQFSALATSPSLSVALRGLRGDGDPATPSSLRLPPWDLPEIDNNMTSVRFFNSLLG
jgi:hypothetical protein